MPEIFCTARRVGDLESRTEEYEVTFVLEGAPPQDLRVRYQAARAYEINASLDAAVDTARRAIAALDADLADKPTDESLQKLAWRAMQSAKYEQGEPASTSLEV